MVQFSFSTSLTYKYLINGLNLIVTLHFIIQDKKKMIYRYDIMPI